MDKKEAINIIEKELSNLRSKSYLELRKMISDDPIVKEIKSEYYQKCKIEITALWDDEPNGNIRIIGSINDLNCRSLRPLSKNFIISPSGDLLYE